MVELNLDRVRRIMEKEGIGSKTKLARTVRVSPSYVTRVFRGERGGLLLGHKIKNKFPEYSLDYLFD